MAFDRLLIPTKFSPPRISPQTTPRTVLLGRLQESRDSRLTLVCGGAGFGKTTLMAQWRQELLKAGEQVSWLSLSPDERQLPQFRAHLVGALERVGMAIERAAPLPPGAPADLAATGLVAAVVDAVCEWGKEVFLFIDDYHHVEDVATHEVIQGLLDHGPETLHLVLASRTTPPFAVSRMRMTGELAEVASRDLPFGFAETEDFLRKHLGDVAPDDARLIHDITDGWPVCVQMICIRLKRGPVNRAALSRLLHRPADLERYLAEDVIPNLAPGVADFLEKISVCRRFNADLARHVTGDLQAASLLEQVERDNLFIQAIEMDSPLPWYRLHPLVASFLEERLTRRDPALAREAHGRASRWFDQHDLLIEALRHAYHANDLDAAAHVVERANPAIRSMGFIGTLQRWMDQLPPDVLLKHPRLLLLGCWALVAVSRWRDAQLWLDRLQQSQTELGPEFALHARQLRASIALQRDDTEAALALVAPEDFESLTDRFVREAHMAVLGFAYCAAGRYEEARALRRRVVHLPRDAREDDMTLVAESNLVLGHLLEGDNREAIRTASSLVLRAEAAQGRRSVSAINCAAYLADAHYEAGHFLEAQNALANRLDLLRFTSPEPMLRAMIAHGRLTARLASPEEALQVLGTDETRCRELELDRPLAHVLAEQARLQLLLNHRDAAGKLQTELDQLADRHRGAAGFLAEIGAVAALAKARLAAASIDWTGALTCLEALRRHGEAYGRQKSLALADLLSGVALAGLGRSAEANERMTAGVLAAQKLGLVLTLLDEGEALMQNLRLLQPVLEADLASAYLADLLRSADQSQQSRAGAGATGRLVQGEALKPREIEILRLVAQSMSNKRIALTLNITVETVKWNLKTTFPKLGVSSRYDAAMAARKLGLID